MATDTITRDGGCACGAVRYRVSGEPIMVHNCHCRLCQKQTGSSSAINAFWESDNIDIAGELSDTSLRTGSGGTQIVRRCPACGTAVLSFYPALGRLLAALRAGTLDDPDSVTPDVILYTDDKMPWVALPQGIRAFAGYYDAREELAPEKFARLRALAQRRKAGEG